MLIMGVGFFVGGLVVVFCYVFFCDFFFFFFDCCWSEGTVIAASFALSEYQSALKGSLSVQLTQCRGWYVCSYTAQPYLVPGALGR